MACPCCNPIDPCACLSKCFVNTAVLSDVYTYSNCPNGRGISNPQPHDRLRQIYRFTATANWFGSTSPVQKKSGYVSKGCGAHVYVVKYQVTTHECYTCSDYPDLPFAAGKILTVHKCFELKCAGTDVAVLVDVTNDALTGAITQELILAQSPGGYATDPDCSLVVAYPYPPLLSDPTANCLP